MDYIVHQHGQQFLYSIDTSRECSIIGSTVYGLSCKFGLFSPLSSYRVYDVEYAKFVSCRCLLEMGVELLDENRLGLGEPNVSRPRSSNKG